ncbi:hypothetical protein B0H67DRAFT_656869 [Lasiosphaeris hirsuta]|uniref:Uncharacterized protein n=1 Tax=Lasiosphaeris hirsuta TaxID=260670 RepID=A0AA40AYL4_9PEZI|nr:hypothetical protein B0H67DRAFT_656869 [Lasiosphaeris hirsuta]
MSMKVIRAAFPLGAVDQDVLNGLAGLAVPTVERNETVTTTAGPSSASPASGGGGDSSGSSGTNAGMIAGIAVGCLALIGFVAVGLYLCFGYRKSANKEELKRKAEAETGERLLVHSASSANASLGGGMGGQKSKEDIGEFPGSRASAMTELPGQVPHSRKPGRFAEMAAESVALEVSTDYNAAPRPLFPVVDSKSPALQASLYAM